MALAKKAVVEKPVEDVAEDVEQEEVAADVVEQTAEVVNETKTEKAVEVVAEKAVAIRPESGTGIVASSGNAAQALAEMGYEGLEGGFYSQTTLKIDNGKFCTAEGDELEETSILGIIMETKRRYAFSTGNAEDDEAVFSYDRITASDGTTLQAKFAEWVQDGLVESEADISEKHYADAIVQVIGGELDGEIIMCSIAPSSVQKLFGYMRGLVYKKLNLKDVVTEISVGKTVKPAKNPKNSYNPWAFKFSRTV